jgi:hypothetical protein
MTLDDDELRAGVSHLNYEVKMVAALFAWAFRLEQTGPTVLKNACLEATLLHIRLVIEFLAGRPRRTKDDPLARSWNKKDLTPQLFVEDWKGLPDKRLDGYLEIIDQYLAHMSLIRAQTIAGRGWALETMVDSILIEFSNYADAAARCASPVTESLQVALVTARQLKTNPPDAWRPILDAP